MSTIHMPPGPVSTHAQSTCVSDNRQTVVESHRQRDQQVPDGEYCKFFSFIRQVGDGTYGRTWLAVDKRTSKRVLAKLLRRTDKNRKVFEKEWKLSRLFSKHPNIIYTYPEAYENDKHRMLVQEFADGGDLCTAIKSGVGLSQVRARRYMGQIATAVQYIHSCGYVHRDIKPENIVLVNVPYEDQRYDKNLGLTTTHAKLIDFGMACKSGTDISQSSVSIPYLPPEVCRDDGSSSPVTVAASSSLDIWSLGVTLFTMLTGMFPWKQARMVDRNYAAFVHWQDMDARAVPRMFERFSPELRELFRRMLAIEPRDRCSAAQCLNYLDVPWFACAGDSETYSSPKQYTLLSDMRTKGLSLDSGISNSSFISCDSGLAGSEGMPDDTTSATTSTISKD